MVSLAYSSLFHKIFCHLPGFLPRFICRISLCIPVFSEQSIICLFKGRGRDAIPPGLLCSSFLSLGGYQLIQQAHLLPCSRISRTDSSAEILQPLSFVSTVLVTQVLFGLFLPCKNHMSFSYHHIKFERVRPHLFPNQAALLYGDGYDNYKPELCDGRILTRLHTCALENTDSARLYTS